MKILRNKKTVTLLSITAVLTVVTGLAVLLLLNSPVKKVDLPDFTDKTIQEIMSWKDTNELTDTQVIYEYVYDEEKEKDTVLSQSMIAGETVGEEDQVTFTISKGHDPDKEIVFPEDLNKLTKDQLNTFFETNRFSDVTFEYVVSEKVKEDYFVSININESSAKRSDMIIVQISAGTKSVGIEIPMPDFSEYSKGSIESWAKPNNITVTFKNTYSDTVQSGKVISQSPEKNTIIKTGDTVTVTLSLGKAVKVDDLKGKTKTEVEEWVKKNNAKVEYFSYYADSTEKDKVISTTPSSGNVSENTTIKVYISLGSVKMIDFTGKKEADIKTWVNTINKSIYSKDNYITYKVVKSNKKTEAASGTIISTSPKKDETVKLKGVITVTVEPEKAVEVTSFAGKTETEFKTFIEKNELALGTKTEKYSTTVAAGSIISNDTGKKEPKTKINYAVSKGAYSPTAASFDGKSETEVKNTISEANKLDAGWSAAFTSEFSNSDASGKTFGCAVDTSAKKITCKVSKGKGVTVPDYVGTNKKPCSSDSCSVDGLAITQKYEYSSSVASGKIISQSVAAGTVVAQNTSVTVIISRGPQDTSVNVADYTGKTEAEFKSGIQSAQMTLGTKTEKYSTAVAAGSILSNDTGKKQPGTAINYVVSLGAYSPSAESFNDKSEGDVNGIISNANNAGAGWSASFSQEHSESITAGKTFGCAVDTSAKKVSCKVSKGPQPVEPPVVEKIEVTLEAVATLDIYCNPNYTEQQIIDGITGYISGLGFTSAPTITFTADDRPFGQMISSTFTEGKYEKTTSFTFNISKGR